MIREMKDKVALVTGGSSGIGQATALAFANQGATVVIASRNQDKGKKVVSEIKENDGDALWIKTDVSQSSEVKSMIQAIIDQYDRLDFAFNNAGTGGEGNLIENLNEKDWDLTINGYLKSVFLCMKYEIKVMLKSGGGAIVNNSSVDGLRGFPWDPAYSAAKHGVLGLTKSVAMQYATKNIRINAICPGWIRTPPVERIIENNPESESNMILHQPIGRLGKPEEVAEAVIWLCSNKSSFILGTNLAVDGGYLIV
ncbi:MAG: glucose 1-dehydrogenase [Candidatus Hermodarchaeota archaeon]